MAEAMVKSMVKKAKVWTTDSWQNALTGLGIIGKDKRMSALAKYRRFTKRELEDTYACDDVFSKIVDIPADDMVREGFAVLGKDEDQTLDEGVQGYLDERNGHHSLAVALNWARLYGGAGILMGINDGKESEEPVDENSIASIDFYNTLDRYELEPLLIQTDPEDARFGLPQVYRLQPTFGGAKAGTVNVHWTRVLRFDGVRLPRQLYVENNYWHASVLQKTYNAIRNFQSSHDGVAAIMQDFAQAVFKINDLSDIIAQGNDDLLQKRLAMIDSMRSVIKAVVIEEGEEFERKMTSLAGVKDVLTMINQRLVIATDGIPHTILLGESPSGLGATGDSEIRDYYDNISRKQETMYKPELERMVRYMMLSGDGPTGGTEPPDWKIKFNPLWQMSEKELVEIRKGQAETDERYLLNGVLGPDEIRKSRFGGTEFSLETKLESPELENRLLITPQNNEENPEEDPIMDSLKATRKDRQSHTHRDIDNNFLGPAIPSFENPGFHWHIGKDGKMYGESADGPGHKHKCLTTGFMTEPPTPLEERPDLVEEE